jgi:hypothetical protein
MNRLNRLLTRPLLFALAATAMVAAVGEPVDAPAAERLDPAASISASVPTEPALPAVQVEAEAAEVEVEVVRGAELSRAENAARLRWLITLPHARNSCCRRPA